MLNNAMLTWICMTSQETYTVTTQNYHSCEMQHNKNSHIKTPYLALKYKQNIKVPQSTHPLSPAPFVFCSVFSLNCSSDNKSFFHAFLHYAKLIFWTVYWRQWTTCLVKMCMTDHFMFNLSFFKSCQLWDNMENILYSHTGNR